MKSLKNNINNFFVTVFCLVMMLLGTNTIQAQVKGNKNLVTKKFLTHSIDILDVNISADLWVLTQADESYIEITTDENLVALISRDVENGTLDLNQVEWISASSGLVIKIGAPQLRKLVSSAHGKTAILDLDQDRFEVAGNVGEVRLEGKVDELDIQVKLVKVDASKLLAQNAKVVITSWGSAVVQVANNFESEIADNAKLVRVGQPNDKIGSTDLSSDLQSGDASNDIRYIDFKLKNNSLNRHQLMVMGKKPQGGSFSYGFAMWPGQVRKKRWPTGSEVYKVNAMGFKKLVFTLDGSAEGETAKIF